MRKRIIIGVSIIAVIAVATSLIVLFHQTSNEKESVGASLLLEPMWNRRNRRRSKQTRCHSPSLALIPKQTPSKSQKDPNRRSSDGWTLGGDFRQIVSFPIDMDTVFGSPLTRRTICKATPLPCFGEMGRHNPLGGNDSTEYYEPQDGSGDGSQIVWQSSTINTVDQTGYDNWQIQIWDKSSSSSKVLGSAEELNGTNATPQTYGEIVPTANDDHVYFASNIKINGKWQESVLSWSLKSAETQDKANIIDSGNFPPLLKRRHLCRLSQTENQQIQSLFQADAKRRTYIVYGLSHVVGECEMGHIRSLGPQRLQSRQFFRWHHQQRQLHWPSVR